jgi:hypothetical protein
MHKGNSNKRKYPRRAYCHPGELELRTERGARVSRAVTIVSLSPEGAGLSLRGAALPVPLKGSMVTLRFKLGDEELELPGRVMWVQPTTQGANLGIQLILEMTMAAMRRTYAQWIVNELRAPALGEDTTESRAGKRAGQLTGKMAGKRAKELAKKLDNSRSR